MKYFTIASHSSIRTLQLMFIAVVLFGCSGGGGGGDTATSSDITIIGSVQDYPVPGALVRLLNENEQELAQTTADQEAKYEISIQQTAIEGTNMLYLEASNPTNGHVIRSALDVSEALGVESAYQTPATVISHYSEAAVMIGEAGGVPSILDIIDTEIQLDSSGRPTETSNPLLNALAAEIRHHFHNSLDKSDAEYRVALLARYIEIYWPSIIQVDQAVTIELPIAGSYENVDVSVKASSIQNLVTIDNRTVTIEMPNQPGEGEVALTISEGSVSTDIDMPVVAVAFGNFATSNIDSDAGGAINLGSLNVTVPPNAISKDSDARITELTGFPSSVPSGVIAAFDIDLAVNILEPITVSYRLPPGQTPDSVVLVHVNSVSKEVEYIYASNYDSGTGTIEFSLDSLSAGFLWDGSNNPAYSLGEPIDAVDLLNDPVDAFTFVRNGILDYLDDSNRVAQLKNCYSADQITISNERREKCNTYYEHMASKALAGFMRIASDTSALQQLENTTFRYHWWSIFSKNGLEEYLKIRGKVLGVSKVIQNGLQSGVSGTLFDVNIIEPDVYNPSTYPGNTYWFPMTAYRLSRLGVEDWDTRLSRLRDAVAHSDLTNNEKRAIFSGAASWLEASVKQTLWEETPKIPAQNSFDYLIENHRETFSNMGNAAAKIWSDYVTSTLRQNGVTETIDLLAIYDVISPDFAGVAAGIDIELEALNTIQSALNEYEILYQSVLFDNRMSEIISDIEDCATNSKCFGSSVSLRWMVTDNELDGVEWWIPQETITELDVLDDWIERFSKYGDGTSTWPVNQPNQSPTADDVEVDVDSNSSVNIIMIGNDPDGTIVNWQILAQPSNGQLGAFSGNQVNYTPNAGFFGFDSFTVKAVDNDGDDSAPAQITVSVRYIQPSLQVNTAQSLQFIPVGQDVENYYLVSSPSHGTLTNSWEYVSDANFSGTDKFVYEVHELDGDVYQVVATIEVTQPNQPAVVNILSISQLCPGPGMSAVVHVSDVSGQVVTGLATSDYSVNEEISGIESPVSNVTVTPMSNGGAGQDGAYAVVLDFSGSMGSSLSDMQAAAASFVQSLNTDDAVSVVKFDDQVSVVTPLTLDKQSAINAINQPFGGGGTAIYDAAIEGINQVAGAAQTLKQVIVFTDGSNGTGTVTDPQVAIQNALSSNVLIHGIGYGAGSSGELENMATSTGGTYQLTQNVSDFGFFYQQIAQYNLDAYLVEWNTNSSSGDDVLVEVGVESVSQQLMGISQSVSYTAGQSACVNQPPTAQPITITTDMDTPVTVTLIGNDPDGSIAEWRATALPGNGQLGSFVANQVQYIPDAGFYGIDTFIVEAVDAQGAPSSPVQITIVVQYITTTSQVDSGGSVVISPIGQVGAAYNIIDFPMNGSVSWSNGNLEYTPDSNFVGTDGFVYEVIESDGTIYQVVVPIEVMSPVGQDVFPENGLLPDEWTQSTGTNANWVVAQDYAYEGQYSLKSGVISHSQMSAIEMTDNFQAGTVSFYYKVSSENTYDDFNFYIDGVRQIHLSGEHDWQHASFALPAGQHTLKWEYAKDYSVSAGSDAAWIDAVELPDTTTINPTNLDVTVSTADVKTIQLDWNSITGADHYKLYVNPDGVSGFTLLKDNIVGNSTTFTLPVHLTDWVNATYKMEAHDASGVLAASSAFSITTQMINAIGYFKASNAGSDDEFGYSVSISADGYTLAVGAPYEDGSASGINGADNDMAPDSGAVYVFNRIGTAWNQQAYIKASNPGADDRFGNSVSISSDGNTLAIGSYLEDGGSAGINGTDNNLLVDSGAVYVFSRNSGNWSQQAYIKTGSPNIDDTFGTAVSISSSGGVLAVAASGGNFVETFIRNGNVWSSQQHITEPTINSFGDTLDLSSDGTTMAVGAPRDFPLEYYDVGSVVVYNWSGSSWVQQALIVSEFTPSEYEWFGYVVKLSADGNTLAVSAPYEDGSSSGVDGSVDNLLQDSGATYIYTRTNNVWNYDVYIKASTPEHDDHFGYNICLSDDGNFLAIASPYEGGFSAGINGSEVRDPIFRHYGAVYVFIKANGSWIQQAYVKAITPSVGDYFGFGIGCSGDGSTLAIGAFGENGAFTDAGAAYLY